VLGVTWPVCEGEAFVSNRDRGIAPVQGSGLNGPTPRQARGDDCRGLAHASVSGAGPRRPISPSRSPVRIGRSAPGAPRNASKPI